MNQVTEPRRDDDGGGTAALLCDPILSTGDPDIGPCTFTRFVLPFSYRLLPIETKDEPFYRVATGSDWMHAAKPDVGRWSSDSARFTRARREYLTPETGEVLFSRAGWYVLEGGLTRTTEAKNFPTVKGAERIVLKGPGIVLFEASNDGMGLSGRVPLRTGALVFEASIALDADVSMSEWLGFNELFRYWRSPFDEHRFKKHCSWGMAEKGDCLRAWKAANGLDDGDIYGSCWRGALAHPVEINGRRFHLETWLDKETEAGGAVHDTYPDQRAFVWTAVIHRGRDGNGDQDLSEYVREIGKSKELLPNRATPWIRLLNVDEPDQSIHVPTVFEAEWAARRTYRRWANEGCVYGFSGHSGAMLSGACSVPPTWRHFRELYFDQALLLLYLRSTIFRFSARLTRYSCEAARASMEKPSDDFLERFMVLRWQFTLFTNLYQFPIISNQQQSLEMYSLLRREMDVQDLYDEVSSKIHGTHELLALVESGKQSDTTTRLTVVATIGLLLSLLLSFFGINVFLPDESNKEWQWNELWLLLVGFVFIAIPGGIILRHAVAFDRLFRRISKSPTIRR